jgi:hypothetical protein
MIGSSDFAVPRYPMAAIRGWAGLSQGAPLSQLHSQHAKPPGKLAEAVRLRLDSATPQTRRTRADVSESHQSLPSLRSSDELSLSPLKIIRYCLPVHAAPRREFQRNIGTPQCSTTQVKQVDNPPKVNEATRQRPSCRLPDLSLAWAYHTLSQRTKRRRPDFLGQPIGA